MPSASCMVIVVASISDHSAIVARDAHSLG
jgi:hypothetical protein